MIHIDDRPAGFDEVVGHESIVKSLKKSLADPKRPHVFLFTGPSGVGKTTLARICAQMLGAEGVGIIEKNISNETGVDSARDLINESYLTPMEGKIRAYILDEVDKASDSWQAAMKKPMEDVPEHTYYFLCTEFADKVKKAIRTRSLEYTLAPLKDDDMLYLLKKMTRKYEKDLSMKVLEAIVERAGGAPRQGLMLLQEVMDVENEEEALELVAAEATTPEVRELCQKLLKKASWKEIAPVLKGVKEDAETVRRIVLGYMNAVLLNSGASRAFDLIEIFEASVFYSGKPGISRMCYEACLE